MKRLKLEFDILLPNSAFKFNLCRYNEESREMFFVLQGTAKTYKGCGGEEGVSNRRSEISKRRTRQRPGSRASVDDSECTEAGAYTRPLLSST